MKILKKVEWLVIGGGSGGLSVVEKAAEHNINCAIIEDRHWGGTCVNIGCVPKKIFWQTAKSYKSLSYLKGLGVTVGEVSFSWKDLYESRTQQIQSIEKWYENNLVEKGVQVYKGRAKFIDKNTVEINNEQIKANKIFISTGSLPIIPNIEGAGLGWVSDNVFYEKEQPNTITIVGSGYIALEFAFILQALGTQVSLIIRKERVLSALDKELQIKVERNLIAAGVQIIKNNNVSRVTKIGNEVLIELDNHPEKLQTKEILWAIGRKPNTEGLGLGFAGVVFDERQIHVNEFSETNIENIFALGDVAGRPQLTPVAIQEARRLSKRLIENHSKEKVDLSLVPTVVFTQPAIATVGVTQKQGEDKYGAGNIVCYTNEFGSLINDMVGKLNETVFIKMVCDKKTQKILGLHMIGEGVEEILQGFVVAIRMGATKHDFDRTIAIHPTVSEEVVTMKPLF